MQTSHAGGRSAARIVRVATATAALALIASCGGGGGGSNIGIDVLSSSPEWVSGGNALVKVTGDATMADTYRALVNGNVVAATFAADPADGKPVAVVSGLGAGENQVTVEKVRGGATIDRTTRTLRNFPANGPMFSGPREAPFACQTDTFRVYPNGPFLAASTAPECTVPTRVDYLYRNTTGAYVALPSTTALPADITNTTTSDNRTVPYVVRLETGVVNRSIYQTAVLHNPVGAAAEPTATARANGWNGKLVYTFGGGCTGGWYRQGNSTGGVLDDPILRQGYAMASSSLNVYGNNCQDVTPAESMAMVKERFIEAYGRPRATIGWGCSGGSYQQHQIADNYPGLLDGILPGCSFPEVLFGTVYAITDMRLLGNYFRNTAPGTFTDEQQRQVAGVQLLATVYTDTVYNGAMRIAPNEWTALNGTTRTFCPAQVPVAQRWSPTNPTGVRCNVYDHAVNQLGRDPATGYARRPLDNVGVQYGLGALTMTASGITIDQFLDLNERVGGYDVNANFQPGRSMGDPAGMRAAYRSGRLTNGGGGLRDVPIIDYRAYADDQAAGDIHLRYHSFSMRERLVKANGDADNHVMLVEDFRYGYYSSASPLLLRALAEMDKWIAAIQADTGTGTQHQKVVRNKPATLVEGCNTRDATPTFIAERMQRTTGACAAIYPAPAAPRVVAGASVAADVMKCTLKPPVRSEYPAMTDAQWTRLNAVFAGGVCNWTVPGVEQQAPQGTWLSF